MIIAKWRFCDDHASIWRVLTLPLVCIAMAAVSGLLVAYSPFLAIIPLLPWAFAGLLGSPIFRFTFVVIGGLFVLQSSEGFSLPKVAYLMGCALAFGIAIVRSNQNEDRLLSQTFRPLLRMSVAWLTLVMVSFFPAIKNGSTTVDWLRDSIPYLLIALVPFLAIDIASDPGQRRFPKLPESIFVVYGVLTALAFFADFASRRGYGQLLVDKLIFTTFVAPCALLSYAAAQSLSADSRSTTWAALAAAIFVLFVLSGTRTSLVMLAAPIVIILGQGRNVWNKLPRLVVFGILFALAGLVVFVVASQLLTVGTGIITERFLSLSQIFGDSAAGQSYHDRVAQTVVMHNAFTSSPILGVGPGHVYTWVTTQGHEKSGFVLDSPFSIAAKFGIVGVIVFAYTLLVIWRVQKHLQLLGDKARTERDALRGFLATIVLFALLASPIDDKGFSFAVACLLALCFCRLNGESGEVTST